MKTVIIGMNNPYSGDPRYALYPHPENSAGARLCAMFLTESKRQNKLTDKRDYIDGFERMNLVDTPTWDAVSAKVRGRDIKKLLVGRRVIICGVSVLTFLNLYRHEWLVWSERPRDLLEDTFDYVLIPHPSGRCREYNDPEVCRQVGMILVQEWERANG